MSSLESQLAQLAEAQNQQNKNMQNRLQDRRQSIRGDVNAGNYAGMGQDEMNASFGRNSGRGSRRENYYKFKRQDSAESLKLNELLRKSGDGGIRDQQASSRRAPPARNYQPGRHNDFKTIDDTAGKPKPYKLDNGSSINDYDYAPRGNYHRDFGVQPPTGGRGNPERQLERMGSGMQIDKPIGTFHQRHKSTVPQRSGAENQKFQELLQQKYRKQAADSNPFGLVMGPTSNSKKDDEPGGGLFPGIGQALAGISNGPGSQSPLMGGQAKSDLINKYKYDGKKYK